MGEFEEKLNAILSNPEAMAQVASLAQSLGQQQPQESPPAQQQSSPPSSGAESGLGLDPALLQKVLPLLTELNDNRADERAQLLYALRPFLKESRRDKVDQALRAARILHLGKRFLGRLGE